MWKVDLRSDSRLEDRREGGKEDYGWRANFSDLEVDVDGNDSGKIGSGTDVL
jgi:hypothetical protein